MVTAIVLINVKKGTTETVGKSLASLDGVSEAFSVGGRYDLIALLKVTTNEQLADLVNTDISKIQDITETETLISFKAYSKEDLDVMFSMGLS